MNAVQKAGALAAIHIANSAITEALTRSGARRPREVTKNLFDAIELFEEAKRALDNTRTEGEPK